MATSYKIRFLLLGHSWKNILRLEVSANSARCVSQLEVVDVLCLEVDDGEPLVAAATDLQLVALSGIPAAGRHVRVEEPVRRHEAAGQHSRDER